MQRFCLVLLFLLVSAALGAQPCWITLGNVNGENWFDDIPTNRVEDWGYRNQVVIEKLKAKGKKVPEGTNWTALDFQRKLTNFVSLHKAMGNPDILAMVEVESENATHKIGMKLGYETLFKTYGDDGRGINNALFVRESDRLKVTEVQYHSVSDDSMSGRSFIRYPTRQILEVHLRIANKYDQILFVNHWPSQRGPTAARYEVARLLERLKNERLADNPKARIIATGDFNVVDDEEDMDLHPFEKLLLSTKRENPLVDVHDLFMRSSRIAKARKDALPMGTYYYVPRSKSQPPEWNRFDRWLVSQNLVGNSGLRIDLDSYNIVVAGVSSKTVMGPDQKPMLVPRSYEPDTGEGITDHFPIVLRLRAD